MELEQGIQTKKAMSNIHHHNPNAAAITSEIAQRISDPKTFSNSNSSKVPPNSANSEKSGPGAEGKEPDIRKPEEPEPEAEKPVSEPCLLFNNHNPLDPHCS